MKFIGLRKDNDTEEILQYELSIYKHHVSCLYKDKYGVYICTINGKMYKVDHELDYIKEELYL